MKAYSQDLRQRVLRAADQGHTQDEIGKTFAIAVATIKRYLKQRRESGHVLPKAIPGRPATKGVALDAGLLTQLEAIAMLLWKSTADYGKPSMAYR